MELLSKKETDNVPHEDAANEKAEGKETGEQVPSEIEKKQKEVEERLQDLNAKKHNLAHVLKQILNAEEELKRRSIVQQQGTTATRPPGGNAGAQMEGGETDDAANRNTNAQTRTVLRLCGASSSFERSSGLFATQYGCVGPSQPGNPSVAAVTVSASGTNYIASSPSPAGSGGTCVFRESRLQSPWN